MEAKTIRLDLICVGKAYRGEFTDAAELYGWQVDIARGALHKNQNAVKDSFRKKGAGKRKEALATDARLAECLPKIV